jgi:NADH-quinone oxidoreductase subunit H
MTASLLSVQSDIIGSSIGIGDSFWASVPVKIGFVLGLFFVVPLVVGYMEHKVMAHQQARLGPMEAGGFHGWAQLVADGVKFIQKEDIIPRAADRWVFTLAPGVALVGAILVFLVLPLAPGVWAVDLELGLFYALAVGSVSALGLLMGGWASANKFSLIGALRGAAQLIAYELPLVLAAAAVAIQAGTLSLPAIVYAQAGFQIPGTGLGIPYIVPQAVGFGLFFAASLAELNRPPFDMPIADSELVFGFLTEYGGIKFAMFLLTEYGGMVSMSALMTVLYLGGWEIWPGLGVPGCTGSGAEIDCGVVGMLVGTGITMAKVFALAFVMIWARVTYPRLREDQLQRFSWLVLVPLALVNIAVVAVAKVVL